MVIRDCKFILRGSLLVLDKASALVENATLLLAPPPDLGVPNITASSASLFSVKNSTIGTTDLLAFFPTLISGSHVEIMSSSLWNTSVSCSNSALIIENSTIRKGLDIRGSSYVTAQRSEFGDVAIHNSSSAVFRGSQLDYLALWFYRFSELTISGLRPGHLCFWDPEVNCTVKTIYLSITVENCWVGAWGIGAVGSAVVDIVSSELEDVGAYDMAMVDILSCGVSYGALARDRASLDVLSSCVQLAQVMETAALIVSKSSVATLVASGMPYVELENSGISLFSAELGVRASALNTTFEDVDLNCLGDREIPLTNCTIEDTLRARCLCLVSLWNSTVSRLLAEDSARVRLYDSWATELSAKEQARIEVLWSTTVRVLLDGSPLPGASVMAYFSNGTRAESCATGPDGSCKLYLTETIIRADGAERPGPYEIVVSYGLLWAEEQIDPREPSRLEVRLESLVELEVTCLDASGEPLEGARVELSSESGPVENATTDKDGLATFTGLPPGNYTVEVIWLGVRVAEAAITIHGLDEALELSCAVVDAFVLVRGPAGPVEGASVSLRMKDAPDVCLTGQTNSSGIACIEDVPVGDYELEVEAHGFKPYAGEASFSSPGQVVEVLLEPLPEEGGLVPIYMLVLIVPIAAALLAYGLRRFKKGRGRASSS